jgi:hypothetical protein
MQAPRTAPHQEKFLSRQEVTEQDWSKTGDTEKKNLKINHLQSVLKMASEL